MPEKPFLERAIQDGHARLTGDGKNKKITYVAVNHNERYNDSEEKVRTAPPTFVLHVNEPKLFHFSYLRYLENQFRETYGFIGTPIKIIAKGHKEE